MSPILLTLLCIFAVVIIFLIVQLGVRSKQIKSLEDIVEVQSENLKSKDGICQTLNERISKLSKFQTCVDAQAKAAEIISQAEQEANFLKKSANQLVSTATIRKTAIEDESEKILSTAKVKADTILTDATDNAHSIISNAKREASEIVSTANQKIKSNLQKSEENLNDAISKLNQLLMMRKIKLVRLPEKLMTLLKMSLSMKRL